MKSETLKMRKENRKAVVISEKAKAMHKCGEITGKPETVATVHHRVR